MENQSNDNVFLQAITTLSESAGFIKSRLEGVFTYQKQPVLTEDEWDEYGDALELLHFRLGQLDKLVNTQFAFSGELPADVIEYTAVLVENQTACEELVGFILSKPGNALFATDIYAREQGVLLEEVLLGITDNARVISRLMAVK